MINSLITEYDLSCTYIHIHYKNFDQVQFLPSLIQVYLSIIKRTMTDDTIEFLKQ